MLLGPLLALEQPPQNKNIKDFSIFSTNQDIMTVINNETEATGSFDGCNLSPTDMKASCTNILTDFTFGSYYN